MQQNNKNGVPAIVIGTVLLAVHISKLPEKINNNHIIMGVCLLVIIGCGIYANVKSRQQNNK